MTKPAPLFNRLALIGVGLIGSSIARAARALGIVETIVATSRSEATRRRVGELGLADEVVETNAAAAARRRSRDRLRPGRCLRRRGAGDRPASASRARSSPTSGSVKAAVVREMAPHIPAGVHFIPGHPVTGTEHSGPDAGFAELFVNRWCILTPAKDADQSAVAAAVQFWQRSAPASRSCRPSITISCLP